MAEPANDDPLRTQTSPNHTTSIGTQTALLVASPGGTLPYPFQSGTLGATPEADYSQPVGGWRQTRDELSNNLMLPHQSMAEAPPHSRNNGMAETVYLLGPERLAGGPSEHYTVPSYYNPDAVAELEDHTIGIGGFRDEMVANMGIHGPPQHSGHLVSVCKIAFLFISLPVVISTELVAVTTSSKPFSLHGRVQKCHA
jgi:hypothetical protein